MFLIVMQSIRVYRTPVVFRRPSVRIRSGVIPELHTILQTYVCPMVNQCTNIFVVYMVGNFS